MEGVINMKAFKYFIFAFFVFVGTLLHVRADENCSYKDQAALNKEASNVKKSYEFRNTIFSILFTICNNKYDICR